METLKFGLYLLWRGSSLKFSLSFPNYDKRCFFLFINNAAWNWGTMLAPPYPISKIKLHDPLSLGKEKRLTSIPTATATRGRKHLEEILKQSIIIIGYRNQLACLLSCRTHSVFLRLNMRSHLFTTEAVVIYHYFFKFRFLRFHASGCSSKNGMFAAFQISKDVFIRQKATIFCNKSELIQAIKNASTHLILMQ